MSNARLTNFAGSRFSALRSGLPLLLILTLAAAHAAEILPAGAREKLTLNDSLERASKNNPRLLLANKDLSVARTQVRQAQSLYFPKVNLNLDYVRYRNETVGITSPELGSVILEAPIAANRDEQRGNPLSRNLYLGRLGFLQTLYAGGKVTATNRLSQAGLRHAENAVETVRHEVEFDTAIHFYRLLALHKEEALLSSALVEIDKLSKQSASAHGRLALSAAQAEMRKRLSDLNQQEQTVQFQYLQSMGLELFSDVDVEGELTAATDIPELQTVLVWAKQNRAELRETQIQEEVDHLAVELSRAERYPVFLLGGGVELRNDDFPLRETNWNTALSLNIPIFDGFAGYARVKESRYRADQGRLRRIQLEDQVEIEVRTAHSDWHHWRNEVEARQRQTELFERLRRAAYQENQGGNTLAQRLEFLQWKADASTSLIEAQYELCAAESRLSRAVGRPVSK